MHQCGVLGWKFSVHLVQSVQVQERDGLLQCTSVKPALLSGPGMEITGCFAQLTPDCDILRAGPLFRQRYKGTHIYVLKCHVLDAPLKSGR